MKAGLHRVVAAAAAVSASIAASAQTALREGDSTDAERGAAPLSSPAARIASLRRAMADAQVQACMVPSSDPHLSEYPPSHWQARAWLSGFTGSVGTLIVTGDFAGLWVDSRYWVQAERELADSGIALMKLMGGAPQAHVDWLAAHLRPGDVLAVDGAMLALGAGIALESAMVRSGVAVRPDIDLIGAIWTDRPPLPVTPIYEHAAPFAPVSRAEKLRYVREEMAKAGADWHVVSTLDDLAWLFNLRGADVNYNPVFVAHAIIGKEHATLFIDPRKVSETVEAALGADNVSVGDYDFFADALRDLPRGADVLIDPRRITFGVAGMLTRASVGGSGGATLVEAPNPSTLAKARKTSAEAEQVRAVMEQDGAALCEFFAWFEQALSPGSETTPTPNVAPDPSEGGAGGPITELTVDTVLRAARARRPGYVCDSFATIAGFNANGAMPHYRATAAAHAAIQGDGLLLIDSGGQYRSGTTDITRVIPIGQPSIEQMRDFTTVLRGTIALSRARFPDGIRAPMLDAIARAPLWAEGLDYGHGTGHGVGYFLNVHEGPQVISHYAAADAVTAMAEGMITSIEPGLYRPGQWGVRIENLVINRPAAASDFGNFLEFETLTLCPIDTRCIVVQQLSHEERGWLNDYHDEVRRRVSPHVSGAALSWLQERTRPI